MMNLRRFAGLLVATAMLATACGGGSNASADTESSTTDSASVAAAGIRVVSPLEGAAIHDNPPADLVVLDVRTPEEFAEGHLEGAIMIDFYRDDFADQLAELDPDQPYLLYCRSGNRSGSTRAILADLGFVDVADIDGGILGWTEAGLELVQ